MQGRGRAEQKWGGAPALAVLLVALGCASGSEVGPELCFQVRADPDLHFHDGRANPLALFLYTLDSARGIDASAAAALADGGPPYEVISVTPGDDLRVQRTLPLRTQQVVVIADYRRRAGESAGQRMAVLQPRCPRFFAPTLVLSRSELRLE